ncbi:hypothetical protein ABFT51_14225 [Paenibacillus peoriae]|uniref:hypothetical protein n=1 Tax=Paenibacillus peoriae TaxID=59893 RepID=UPI0032AF0C30
MSTNEEIKRIYQWQASVSAISAKEERARFELIQLMHNLVKRQAEVEILPFAASE